MKSLLLLTLSVMTLSALTLDDAIENAMTHAPQLRIASGEIEVAKSAEDEAMSAYHPTLSAGFEWKHTDPTTTFSFSPTHRYNLSATYNLFRGFSDAATLDEKAAYTRAAEYAQRAAKADVRIGVINAFSRCLIAEKTLQTQQESLDALSRQYQDTKVRFEQGMVAKNDLLLIEVDRLRAEQALFKAKSDIITTRSALSRLMGTPLSATEPVVPFEVALDTPAPYETLLKQTYENRSELKMLEEQRAALGFSRDAVQGNYLPHVDLHGDYIINDKERLMGTSVIQPEDQKVVTVNVSWSLYAGMANIARRKALLEQSGIQAQRLEQLKLDLGDQLHQAYEAYRVAKSAKEVASKAMESAKENYRITADRHSYGQVDTLTLLKAQSNLTDANNAYNNAYYDLYVAYKALERISGE